MLRKNFGELNLYAYIIRQFVEVVIFMSGIWLCPSEIGAYVCAYLKYSAMLFFKAM